MTGLHEFIIELKEPLADTFTTEKGVELYANKDFSVDRLSNRVAKVISTPLFHDTVIKVGYEIMFEPTILYKQIYKGVKQHYTALVDSEKMYFKVLPQMIILFRKDDTEDWQGYLQNVMVEQIETKEEEQKSKFLFIPKDPKKKYKKGRVRLLYGNSALEEQGTKNGDELVINPLGGVNFWIEGKHYWWMRNTDIYGVAV